MLQVFSRCGAVPGILDAIVIEGDASGASEHLQRAKEEFTEQGKKWTDVKKQMVVAHEVQVMMGRYGLNLFTPDAIKETGKPLRLSDLEVLDPFPGQTKTLWLRYCRAGDGQRFNSRIPVEADGSFRGGVVHLDMDLEADKEAAEIQMNLTKQAGL